jgi:hypothetical protein
MLPLPQLTITLATVALISDHGPWSRAIGYRYLLGPPPGISGPSTVFPDRISLALGNFLEVFDPDGNLAQRLSHP